MNKTDKKIMKKQQQYDKERTQAVIILADNMQYLNSYLKYIEFINYIGLNLGNFLSQSSQ